MANTQTINFSDEAKLVIQRNFVKGKWGYQQLSKTISKLLVNWEKEKPSLESLKNKEKEILDKQAKLINELQNTKLNIKKMEQLEKDKFNITEREADYLIDSHKLIKLNPNILIKRLKCFSNYFNKQLNEDEFLKLISLAKKKYPKAGGFVDDLR